MRRLRDPQMTPERPLPPQTLEGEATGRFPTLLKKNLLSRSLKSEFSGDFFDKARIQQFSGETGAHLSHPP